MSQKTNVVVTGVGVPRASVTYHLPCSYLRLPCSYLRETRAFGLDLFDSEYDDKQRLRKSYYVTYRHEYSKEVSY